MKLLWRLGKEAIKYKNLYIIAILSTFALTFVNLAAPKILSSITAIVELGMFEDGLIRIGTSTGILVILYLLKILFRYLGSYLAHKAGPYEPGRLI